MNTQTAVVIIAVLIATVYLSLMFGNFIPFLIFGIILPQFLNVKQKKGFHRRKDD
jgi:hypothetical protein